MEKSSWHLVDQLVEDLTDYQSVSRGSVNLLSNLGVNSLKMTSPSTSTMGTTSMPQVLDKASLYLSTSSSTWYS